MSRLFWGLVFVGLNFDITLGSAAIGLLPDFVGWFLLMKGMEELAGENRHFDHGRHWAFGLMLLSVILYVADLLKLSSGATVMLWLVGLLYFGVGMYTLYQMIRGIRQMEADRNWDLQGGKLKDLWMIQTVMGAISHLLSWMPLVGTFAAVAAAVTGFCLLAAMNGTWKRYRDAR